MIQSIKNVGPEDSWQYCSYSLEDLNAMLDTDWIIFSEDMSTGPFASEQEARKHNETYLEWEDIEYITIKEFKRRVMLDPGLEMEPC